MYPDGLIQSTDYATLANSNQVPVTVSVTVPNGSSATVSNSAAIELNGSPIVFSISNSATGDEWSCQQLQYVAPNGEAVNVKVRQTDFNVVSITATPLGGAIDGGNVTFTARVRSFVPPIT